MDKNIIIKDFEKNLNVKIKEYKEIESENGLILNADDLYIIKTYSDKEFEVVLEFENYYKFVKQFIKAIYVSNEYKYMVYNFIEQDRNVDYNKIKLINQIYDLVKEERKIENHQFGYIDNPLPSWYEFLNAEIKHSLKLLEEDTKIDLKIVLKALKIAKKEKVEAYLVHGDLGVHNFIIKDKLINVINPIGLIGDYLYDFYYAILSDYSITDNLDIDFVISYFDRKEKYKKALFIIVYFIRMARAYKYNKADYEKFLNDYKYLSLK